VVLPPHLMEEGGRGGERVGGNKNKKPKKKSRRWQMEECKHTEEGRGGEASEVTPSQTATATATGTEDAHTPPPLPPEMWEAVFASLPASRVVVVRSVCSTFRALLPPPPRSDARSALACFAANGEARCLRWLLGQATAGATHPRRALLEAAEAAARRGRERVLWWLLWHHPPWGDGDGGIDRDAKAAVISAAARGGRRALVEALRQIFDCPWRGEGERALSVAEAAACARREADALSVLDYAAGAGCPVDAGAVSSRAAMRGHIGVLEWMLAAGHAPTSDAHIRAAASGRIDVAEWLLSHGVPVPAAAAVAAVRSVRPAEMLRWLFAHGCRPSSKVALASARLGRADVLTWLLRDCAEWRSWIGDPVARRRWAVWAGCLTYAARNGQLAILDAMAEEALQPEGLALVYAGASHGEETWRVLRWATDRGAQRMEIAALEAAATRRWGLLLELHERGWPVGRAAIMEAALSEGSAFALRELRSRGVAMDSTVLECALWGGNVEVAEWAEGEGCPWTLRACVAVSNGAGDRVRGWLAARGGCPIEPAGCGGRFACWQRWSDAPPMRRTCRALADLCAAVGFPRPEVWPG
jgi:hypothetical protein